MSRFKIGQKVVCVEYYNLDQKFEERSASKKNDIVIVSGKDDFEDINFISLVGYNSMNFYDETHFAPLQADNTSKELTLEIEEFELETIEYN